MPKIPCTIAILTRNSGSTLKRALESAHDFAEIIICDSDSTDNTRTIATAYSARIIEQDSRYLDGSGRICNYAGVRNQTLAAASYQWFFFLDSDEYLSRPLVDEIRARVTQEPVAYWVPRKYEYRGVVIDHAVTYPSIQMRFFNTAVADGFIKEIHEKIELRSGIVPKTLTNYMIVPMPDSVEEMYTKWRRYLAIEKDRRPYVSVVQWLAVVWHELGVAVLYLLRLLRIRLFNRGTKLPIRFELARIWYQWALIRDSFSAIRL